MSYVGAHGEMILYTPWGTPGFLLLSTDDCVRPVLAYSYTDYFSFEDMPVHIRQWIEGYENEIAARVAAGEVASPEVAAEWQRWLEGSPKSEANHVDPLLTTRWGQNPYYNEWAPFDSAENVRTVAGCVAVAMGQVMKYWNHPSTGMGSNTYTSVYTISGTTYTYGPLSVDFGATTYDWEHMPDELSALSDSVSVNAVAQLLYHAGVAVNMMYTRYGSGANTVSYDNITKPSAENALRYNFRYSQSLSSFLKAEFSNSQWVGMMKHEMDLGQPVIYSATDPVNGGHTFVMDGYDTLGLFHFNWGWKGSCDGFYVIDSLAPPRGGYNFSTKSAAIIGIRPMDSVEVSTVEVNVVSSDSSMGIVTGSGTYVAMSDTVFLYANAAEGYRFVRWTSGNLNNPRSFWALNDITDTAVFEPIPEDTMSYCGNLLYGSWRYSTTTSDWAICLPASTRPQERRLSAVQLFVNSQALYELRVYVGDSIADSTLVHTQSYNVQSANNLGMWHSIAIDTSLIVPAHKSLWIAFHVENGNGKYPVSFGRHTGNVDAGWYRDSAQWIQSPENKSHTWLIRALLVPREQVRLAVTPNDIELGDVLGGGFFWPGDTVVVTALPVVGCSFVEWSTGSTDNPYSFVLTQDMTLVAFFERNSGIDDVSMSNISFSVTDLTITVSNPENSNVILYDIQGRQLASSSLPVFNYQFSTPGVYLLQVDGLPARRIVVIR